MTDQECERITAAIEREAAKLPPLSPAAAARAAAIIAPAFAAIDSKRKDAAA